MIYKKQDILEDIQARIDEIVLALSKDKKNQALQNKLVANKDAYEFNRWLIWKHLDFSPYSSKHKTSKIYKTNYRDIQYDLKPPVKLNDLDSLMFTGEYNGEEYQDIIDDFKGLKDDDD